MADRIIKVSALARVEGEGSLYVRVKDREIKDIKFGIFEPPRFFEAFLRGRSYLEVPDITARICGICPIAYEIGAIQAMENALNIKVEKPVRDLRRLIYCGEWIESHGLHVYMLHAPDFLGLADALQLAKVNRPLVEKALKLKKLGNEILEVIGGRAIHPVNLRVGGFYRIPRKKEVRTLIEPLKWALEASIETVKLTGGFDFPVLEQDYAFVALRHEEEYAIHEGRIISNWGLDIDKSQFLDHFDEEHVKHSNALHGYRKSGKPISYKVGPLARYALNYDKLGPEAKAAAKAAGLGPVVRNPFQSIVVRSVELVQACADALKIVENYEEPSVPYVEAELKEAVGYGCTEAPRGICFHRYRIDATGAVQEARIMPPTAQNQKTIEWDLERLVEANLDLPDEKLKWVCEQAIRNYDPCISCATHFLNLTVERE
jgi:sulfhydrogenase subunit alpha